MFKTLILAINIFFNDWHAVENTPSYLDGIAYSIAEADCRINSSNLNSTYTCIMACNVATDWFTYSELISLMPRCEQYIKYYDITLAQPKDN